MSKHFIYFGVKTYWRDLNNFQRSVKFIDYGNDLGVGVVSK